ncbi:MAG: hypothetical protein H6744_20665 [Deltaproteobacteria bacterium]|nr:hypothetical protein [Deltaproteobacteria bacterium]
MQTTVSSEDLQRRVAQRVRPGSFVPSRHFYPQVLDAELHPLVSFFLDLSIERIASRYCHLRPQVDRAALLALLRTRTRHLGWAGADLFYTVNDAGLRRMLVVETNSCPSGHKSMPLRDRAAPQGGYRRLLEHSVLPHLEDPALPPGGLAVLYDKNVQEASGYAATLADLTGEDVLLCPLPADAAARPQGPPARFRDGVLEVRDDQGRFTPIRLAMRYVTRRPWTRIPVRTRTRILNPVIACLAGGRNKLVAAKAYEALSDELADAGLQIRTPETLRDVAFDDIPQAIQSLGGYAVVKNPYSNAGAGVWTIMGPADLGAFLAHEQRYERFIVQGLVGNARWSSGGAGSRHHHVGTMPDARGDIYVADLRMMVCSGPAGFIPVSLYARRARAPLPEQVEPGVPSWPMLGTNLSVPREGGGFAADTERLMITDTEHFNTLGLGPDDLIDAYVQTVLSIVAIDRCAESLLDGEGELNLLRFRALDDDPSLVAELMPPAAAP